MPVNFLWCDHCGSEAVEADRDGLFGEDMTDRCMSCKIPGNVVLVEEWQEIVESEDPFVIDEQLVLTAEFASSSEGKCADETCEECRETK